MQLNPSEFIAEVIIHVMQDDPSKIVEVRQAAEAMPIFEGERIHDIMAEEALHMFRTQNSASGSFPELKDIDDDRVMTLLANAFIEKEW